MTAAGLAAPLLAGRAAASAPIFFDQDGLIVHRGLDGGDTAQREGWYWTGAWIREHLLRDPWPERRQLSFRQVLRLLEPQQDGVFYRHPKLPPWNNPHDAKFGFSRDQMTALVAAMGLWGETDALRRLWNALPQDPVGGTKHTFNGSWKTAFSARLWHTGDIVGPASINLFRRAWNEDPLSAADGNGLAGDKELLVNAGLKVPPALSDRDNTGDDLNHIIELLMSIIRYPSQTSSAAVSIYSKNRLVSYGSFLGAYRAAYGEDPSEIPFTAEVRDRLDKGIAEGWTPGASRAYGAVRWYHRPSTGANSGLAELYAPIIRAYLE